MHYRGLASVRHYVLVAQDRALIELYTRQDDGTWSLSDHRSGTVELRALGCALALDEVYRRVLPSAGG